VRERGPAASRPFASSGLEPPIGSTARRRDCFEIKTAGSAGRHCRVTLETLSSVGCHPCNESKRTRPGYVCVCRVFILRVAGPSPLRD